MSARADALQAENSHLKRLLDVQNEEKQLLARLACVMTVPNNSAAV